MVIDVAKEFHDRLTNRNVHQGDGRFTAEEFRGKFLLEFDSQEFWNKPLTSVVFDFAGVRKIGPSFANEAFAYFMKFTNPSKFYDYIKFVNISRVQKMIIEQEVESGYSK